MTSIQSCRFSPKTRSTMSLTANIIRDIPAIRAAFTPQFTGAFGTMKFLDEDLFIDADTGKVMASWRCTLSVKGQPTSWRGLDLLHFKGNKLIRRREYNSLKLFTDSKSFVRPSPSTTLRINSAATAAKSKGGQNYARHISFNPPFLALPGMIVVKRLRLISVPRLSLGTRRSHFRGDCFVSRGSSQ